MDLGWFFMDLGIIFDRFWMLLCSSICRMPKPPGTKRNNGKPQEHADNCRNMQTSSAAKKDITKTPIDNLQAAECKQLHQTPLSKYGGGGTRAAWRIRIRSGPGGARGVLGFGLGSISIIINLWFVFYFFPGYILSGGYLVDLHVFLGARGANTADPFSHQESYLFSYRFLEIIFLDFRFIFESLFRGVIHMFLSLFRDLLFNIILSFFILSFCANPRRHAFYCSPLVFKQLCLFRKYCFSWT